MKYKHDTDTKYDEMKDDFATCKSVKDALYLISKYGIEQSKIRLPKQYLYLTKK